MITINPEGYCDVFTLTEFGQAVHMGVFIPDDGTGYYGTKEWYYTHLCVWDDTIKEVPKDCTHVVWFSK